MQASSESDYQEESNIENAKTSIKRKAPPSPNIGNEKEQRRKNQGKRPPDPFRVAVAALRNETSYEKT